MERITSRGLFELDHVTAQQVLLLMALREFLNERGVATPFEIDLGVKYNKVKER